MHTRSTHRHLGRAVELLGDRFFRLTDGRWIDAATSKEVGLTLMAAASTRACAEWLERCDSELAAADPDLLDYGWAGSTGRFEARRVPLVSCPRNFGDTTLASRRSARTRPLRLTDGRPPYGHSRWTDSPLHFSPNAVEPPAEATSAAEIVREIADRIEYGRTVGWDQIQVAASGREETTIVAAVARGARLRGYVPLALETCVHWPQVIGLVRDVHVLLIVSGSMEDLRHRELTRAIIQLGWSSARPHLLLRFTGAARRSDGSRAVLMVAESPATYVDSAATRVGSEERADDIVTGVASPRVQAGEEPGPLSSERTLAIIPDSSAALRSAVAKGLTLAREGRLAPAERLLRETMQALVRRGCHPGAGCLALDLGRLLLSQGRTKDAVRVYEEARQAFERCGDHRGLCEAAIGTGLAWTDEGRLARAEGALRAAQLAAEVAGDRTYLARAARALARVRFWQGRFSEALALAAEPGLDTTAARAADLSFRARCQLAFGEVGEAGSLVAAALDELARGTDGAIAPALAADVHTTAVLVQGAVGDRAALMHHAARALVEARRARSWPFAFEVRLALLESARRLSALGGRSRLRRLAAPLARYQTYRLPQLWRVRLQLALAATGLDETASRMRREAARFIQVNGIGGLDRSRQERPAMDVVQDVIDVMRICHEVDDEPSALARVCWKVRERSRALTVGFFPADHHDAPLSFAGSTPRGTHHAARRAIETGLPIPPARYGTAVEAAAPVRYGGQTVAALAGRWAGDVPIGSERATALLAAAATASAPGVRAALDRRAAPAAVADRRVVELVGESEAMAALRHQIARAAGAPFAVLIEGESGSGKELVARAIHRQGPRQERRFCALNCAALADELIEAELFGYARGAFMFEEADEGTLFLDEVSELSARAQAKLLRAIQEREIRRIGENFSRRVDVRIIAATNQTLAGEAAAGRFRRDLLYRLDVVKIAVPPLRARVEDIPVLALRFWTRALAHTGSRATLDPTALAALTRYDWPGNVRELENVMAALAVGAPRRGRVGPAALPPVIASAAPAAASTLEEARRHFEQRYVRAALARAGGHRGRAARDLGVSRQGLAKLLARLGLAGEGPVE